MELKILQGPNNDKQKLFGKTITNVVCEYIKERIEKDYWVCWGTRKVMENFWMDKET